MAVDICTFVKSGMTSQAIHHLMSLALPSGTLKVIGGKCKIKWESVCLPTNLGGPGILDLEKICESIEAKVAMA